MLREILKKSPAQAHELSRSLILSAGYNRTKQIHDPGSRKVDRTKTSAQDELKLPPSPLA